MFSTHQYKKIYRSEEGPGDCTNDDIGIIFSIHGDTAVPELCRGGTYSVDRRPLTTVGGSIDPKSGKFSYVRLEEWMHQPKQQCRILRYDGRWVLAIVQPNSMQIFLTCTHCQDYYYKVPMNGMWTIFEQNITANINFRMNHVSYNVSYSSLLHCTHATTSPMPGMCVRKVRANFVFPHSVFILIPLRQGLTTEEQGRLSLCHSDLPRKS